jgi:hypothetical protein
MAQEFALVRILPSGNEQDIAVYPVDPTTQTWEAIEVLRATLLVDGRGRKFSNPAHRYAIYGPTEDDAPRTVDDRVWDSEVDA